MNTNLLRACIVWVVGLFGCGEGTASLIEGLPPPPTETALQSLATPSGSLQSAPGPIASWLGLLQRGGEGPFRLVLSRDTGGIFPSRDPVPSNRWHCRSSKVVDQPGHAAFLLEGCSISDARGDFDFAVHLAGPNLGKTDWWVELTNRLDVGVAQARIVLRLPKELLPSGPDTALFLGQDEYVTDPVTRLTKANHLPNEPWGLYFQDDDTRGFYFSFQGVQPVLSIHRPGVGLIVHDLDPVNGSTGQLFAGSNDGALEFGYAFSAEGELEPGNGRTGVLMQLGPKVRLQALPGARPIDTAWWETAMAYREHALAAQLLPSQPLARASNPARWSHDCLYTVLGMGASTSGTAPGTKNPARVDVAAWTSFMDGMIRFHGATGQRSFCPLLWGWSAVSPYRPIAGVAELLREFEKLERLHGVEIHSGVYVLPSYVSSATFGTPLEAAVIRDLHGDPFSWDPVPHDENHLYAVDVKHPLFVADLLGGVDTALRLGVEWVYVDNPFTSNFVSRAWGGIDSTQPQGVRDLVKGIERRLAANGGGIIACERQKIGLPASVGEGSGRAMPGSRFVPFGTAVAHDFLTTSGFGDAFGGSFELWNAEPILGGSDPGAALHFPRYALDGAAIGATGLDGHLGPTAPFYGMRGHPDPRLDTLAQISDLTRKGLTLRRTHDALRTGRLLPPQQVSGGTVVIARRRSYEPGFGTHREPAARYTTAMFESLEKPGAVLLTISNPEPTDAEVEVTIDPSVDRALQRAFVVGGAREQRFSGTAVETLHVAVPARDVRAVTFTPVR